MEQLGGAAECASDEPGRVSRCQLCASSIDRGMSLVALVLYREHPDEDPSRFHGRDVEMPADGNSEWSHLRPYGRFLGASAFDNFVQQCGSWCAQENRPVLKMFFRYRKQMRQLLFTGKLGTDDE